jgi:phenylalanyl-tRNA synthetase beta chain
MKVPLSWLREYVAFEDTPEGLADRLTFSGIEVEGIAPFGPDLTGLVAARVEAVERHPQADRLTVCRVFDGAAECGVVCGAPNVRAGGVYPFAPAGATLPNGMKIKTAKLRGVVSNGMLCAEDELGLSDDHGGLMELDPSVAPGTPLTDLFGRPDTVLDLEITPNRPDCLGLLGIAREVAALYGLPLRRPEVELTPVGPEAATEAAIEVRDAEACPRYTARVIRNVVPGAAPLWMQRRLAAAGVRPIDVIVDITNYVMLETGQPLHAFDLSLLRGRRVIVRRAAADERIVTLDGQARTLSPEMLVIADAEGPVAVAGVMGGAGSEIRPATSTVLLESAAFHRGRVRATARALGLATESSHRFARGVDPGGVDWAGRRAAALLQAHAGGAVAPGLLEAYPAPPPARTVRVRPERVAALLGAPAEGADIAAALGALEIPARVEADGGVAAEIPGFREDLTLPEDLAEEFARLRGLDAIPERAPVARLAPGADDRPARARRTLHEALVGLGLTEVMNYSLTSPALLDRVDAADAAARLVLPHPLSEEQSVLRPSLLPQVIDTLGRNRARQTAEAAVFELGRVFRRTAEGGHAEAERVAIGLLGPVGRDPLRKRAPATPAEALSWLRGILDALARALHAPVPALAPAAHPAFEPGLALALTLDGVPAGVSGILRRALAAEERIYEPVALAELDPAPWLAAVFTPAAPAAPPVHPSSTRDVAFFVPRAVRHAQVVELLRRAVPGPELERVELFDIFEGRAAGEGRKSMAYSLTFRAAGRTLKDEEVLRFHEAAMRALKEELGAELRDA